MLDMGAHRAALVRLAIHDNCYGTGPPEPREHYSYAYIDWRKVWDTCDPTPVLPNMLPPVPWIMRGKNMERCLFAIIMVAYASLWLASLF